MTEPVVSVIIPVYNTMPYLTSCLDSLVDQSIGLDRLQIIAVDDGSTDGGAELLDAYATRHPGSIHVVHQANSGGPAGPCNRGLELARGTYVFFLGADDYLGTEALERLVRAASHWNSDVIFGRMVGVGGRYVDRRMFGSSRRDVSFTSSPLAFALSNTKLFRRSLIEENQLRYALELRVGSDQPFTVAALIKSRRTSVLCSYDFYFAVRRADASNITYSHGWRTRLSDIEAVMDHLADLVEPGEVRDALFHRHFSWEMDKLLRNELPLLDHGERGALARSVAAVAARYLSPGVSRGLAPKVRLPVSLTQVDQIDTLRRVISYQSAQPSPPLVLSGDQVFEWAPGFDEADCDRSWYEVPSDDVTRRLLSRVVVTAAEFQDHQLLLNGRMGVSGDSARQVSIALQPIGRAEIGPAPLRFRRGAAPRPAATARVALQQHTAGDWSHMSCRVGLRQFLSAEPSPVRWAVRLRVDAGSWTYDVPVSVDAVDLSATFGHRRHRRNVGLRTERTGALALRSLPAAAGRAS